MTDAQLRTVVLDAISGVAPEADVGSVDPSADLREQFELDSFDALNVIVGIDQALGVEIPERDYGQLTTLDACVDYLARRLDEQHVQGS